MCACPTHAKLHKRGVTCDSGRFPTCGELLQLSLQVEQVSKSPLMVYMGRNLISNTEGFWMKLEPEVPIRGETHGET